MKTRIFIGSVWLLALVVSSGCAIGADPLQRAMDRSREVVETGVERGRSQADSRDALWVDARYNPCNCPAPAFEIYARSRWKRVIVAGEDDVVDELFDAMEGLQASGKLAGATVRGRFDGSADYEENGAEYERFVVTEFDLGDE